MPTHEPPMPLDPRSVPNSASPRDAAMGVVRVLREAGHVAYFAGGCVRDELLGLHPKDYDVATDAPPQRVTQLFPRTAEVGAHFGVVLVKIARAHVVEVATFRTEGAYTDKRRPDSVSFAGPDEDAHRRDFTINALFLHPLESPRPGEDASPLGGRVIDLVGGAADLRARVLRAVGDPEARLAEDHLRALRGVRFAARLGLTIDEATARAIRLHARDLLGVSRERIGDEVRKMLLHPTRARAVELLAELELEAPVMDAKAGDLRLAGGTVALGGLARDFSDVGVILGAYVLDCARGEGLAPEAWADRLRRALMLSNDERASLLDALRGWRFLRFEGWSGAGVAQRKRFAASASWVGGIVLLRATDADLAARAEAEVAALAGDGVGISPAALLTGDALHAQGWKGGPVFRRVLEGVYDAQLEGRVKNLEEALELARRLRD